MPGAAKMTYYLLGLDLYEDEFGGLSVSILNHQDLVRKLAIEDIPFIARSTYRIY